MGFRPRRSHAMTAIPGLPAAQGYFAKNRPRLALLAPNPSTAFFI